MLFIGINVYYYDHHYPIPALSLSTPHPTPSVIFQPFLKTVTRPRVAVEADIPRVYKIIPPARSRVAVVNY